MATARREPEPTWESHLFGVAKLTAPMRLPIEQVMDKASLLAVELGRRDWARSIWEHRRMSNVLVSAGIGHGHAKVR
jgi:hypothetical protein